MKPALKLAGVTQLSAATSNPRRPEFEKVEPNDPEETGQPSEGPATTHGGDAEPTDQRGEND
jgi:hypothetical protein